MSYAINLLSVIPMRKEPAHRSEMVSQLLFGEYVEVLEKDNDFWQVKGLYDGYEGWVQVSQLTEIDQLLETELYIAHWTGKVAINDHYKNLPFGSPIYATDGSILIGKHRLTYDLN
ncbi:MAG: NlpC/P60 family protein, partial [Flaviaesturariibacter sp.]|nr:NlpC/P60 family protein [Flaviaesturariibacter sp.]